MSLIVTNKNHDKNHDFSLEIIYVNSKDCKWILQKLWDVRFRSLDKWPCTPSHTWFLLVSPKPPSFISSHRVGQTWGHSDSLKMWTHRRCIRASDWDWDRILINPVNECCFWVSPHLPGTRILCVWKATWVKDVLVTGWRMFLWHWTHIPALQIDQIWPLISNNLWNFVKHNCLCFWEDIHNCKHLRTTRKHTQTRTLHGWLLSQCEVAGGWN